MSYPTRREMIAAVRGRRAELKQARAVAYNKWRTAQQDQRDAERVAKGHRERMEWLDAQVEKVECDLAMLGPFS